MSHTRIVFAHGLEGSPDGAKITALRAAGFDVIAPDGRGMCLADRLTALEALTLDGDVILGGSSYGGLAAAWLADRYPERLSGLLLCAPALHWSEPPANQPDRLVVSPAIPTIVLHGQDDATVPIDVSVEYQARSGSHVDLWILEDDHRLRDSHERLIAAMRSLIDRCGPTAGRRSLPGTTSP